MKKIEAIINPFKLETVKRELSAIGIENVMAIDGKESCQHGSRALVFRGSRFVDDFTPITKIEIVVANEMMEPAVEIIREAARTEKGMDGKIFVSTVEQPIPARAKGHRHEALHA